MNAYYLTIGQLHARSGLFNVFSYLSTSLSAYNRFVLDDEMFVTLLYNIL